MIYLMSDIHGCYAKYLAMLKKINFSDEDTLYILGDVVDRGDQPIKVLFDMMKRPNVIPILGNHEYAFKKSVETIPYHCKKNDFMPEMDEDAFQILSMWVFDGGDVTLDKYLALSTDEKHKVLEYLDTFKKHIEITVNDKIIC